MGTVKINNMLFFLIHNNIIKFVIATVKTY